LGNCANGATDGDKGGFTVFEMPHMRASVVLTTLRAGLLGLHSFALISGEMVVLGELPTDADGGGDDCWAYA
jgi:hypothetical protein